MTFEEWTKKIIKATEGMAFCGEQPFLDMHADWKAEREKLIEALENARDNMEIMNIDTYDIDTILAEIDAKGGGE